jgi:hypothetical protein
MRRTGLSCGAGNSARSRLSAGFGRLKGGCGQDWPFHNFRLAWALLLALPAIGQAAEGCPWLNAATASGILGGPVAITVTRAKTGDDATCDFVRHEGSLVQELRIEVETMRSPAKAFASYVARCHSTAVPLKAIGNEALACSDGQLAEQVVGRVRDRAFLVRISTTDRSGQQTVLRDKIRKIAEQVAGILF